MSSSRLTVKKDVEGERERQDSELMQAITQKTDETGEGKLAIEGRVEAGEKV